MLCALETSDPYKSLPRYGDDHRRYRYLGRFQNDGIFKSATHHHHLRYHHPVYHHHGILLDLPRWRSRSVRQVSGAWLLLQRWRCWLRSRFLHCWVCSKEKQRGLWKDRWFRCSVDLLPYLQERHLVNQKHRNKSVRDFELLIRWLLKRMESSRLSI